MDNLDFDKKIREMMEGYTEEPSVNSWDSIASDLQRRRDTRIRRARRNIYAYSAVAAAVLLFLVLSPNLFTEDNSIQVAQGSFANLNSNKIHQEIAIAGHLKTPEQLTSLGRRNASRHSIEVAPILTVIDSTNVVESVDTPKSASENIESAPNTQQSEVSPKSDNRVVRNVLLDDMFGDAYEERLVGKPLLAVAAGVSPSFAGSYTGPVMMSEGYDGRSNVASPVYMKSEAPREEVFEEEYMMPVTLGVQVFFPITQRFSVGTGVNYSFLSTKYSQYSINSGVTEHRRVTLHYAGVPINFQYKIFYGDLLKFYALAGTTIEKGLTAVNKNVVDGSVRDEGDKIKGVQLSVNAGLGLEFALSNSMGLYFDPTVTYYFDNKKNPQPLSIREVQPLLFRFEAGMRFRL